MTRRGRQPATRACLTAGCGAAIPRWQLLCDVCLGRLPWSRRRALLDAPKHRKFSEATDAAEWLAAHSPAAEAARRTGERID